MSCVSRRVFVFAALLASAILGAGSEVAAQQRPQKLVVGLLPSEAPETVLRLNEPLRAYLQKRLGMPVELKVASTYVSAGEDLQLGHADIAYLGPIVYLLRSRTAKLEAFARPLHEGTGPFFKVVTIVPAASTAQTLTDLKGAIVAFGDRASGAIWVVRYQLLLAGFMPGQDYTIRGMGDNTNVARAVTEGLVYAGCMSQPVFNRLMKEGKIDPKSVRVIAESPNIPEYMWTFRDGLAPAFKEEIRKAILEVNDPEMLKVFRASSFIPSDEADLEQARKWIVATEAAIPGTVPKAK